MSCNCGKPKCNGKCGISPAVLQINNPDECTLFHRVVIPASMGDSTTNPPKNGAYRNVLLHYEADGSSWLYSSDGIPTLISSMDYEDLVNLPQINGVTLIGNKTLSELGITKAIDDAVAEEASIRSEADSEIWREIENIQASSDVVDIVGTYAELQAYDTSKLADNDVIKVLRDETHDNAISYYRWNEASDQFVYVGSQGPYYSIFWLNSAESGSTRHIYSDNTMQSAVTMQNILDAADNGSVVLRFAHISTPEQYNEYALVNVWVYPDDDYQLAFTDGRDMDTYSTTSASSDVFDYYHAQLQYKMSAGTGIKINNNVISGASASVDGTTLVINNA